MQIKCDKMPKNEVSQFMENLCPFCAAEFVDPKNVMVILLTHISFRKKNRLKCKKNLKIAIFPTFYHRDY